MEPSIPLEDIEEPDDDELALELAVFGDSTFLENAGQEGAAQGSGFGIGDSASDSDDEFEQKRPCRCRVCSCTVSSSGGGIGSWGGAASAARTNRTWLLPGLAQAKSGARQTAR